MSFCDRRCDLTSLVTSMSDTLTKLQLNGARIDRTPSPGIYTLTLMSKDGEVRVEIGRGMMEALGDRIELLLGKRKPV